jgi:hypothetical protein
MGQGTNANIPSGYDEKRAVGRPEEKSSIINTQNDPLGKDRLGAGENSMLNAAIPGDEGSGTPKGGSPLAIAEAYKNKFALGAIPTGLRKEIVFGPDQEPSLLNENNIKGI